MRQRPTAVKVCHPTIGPIPSPPHPAFIAPRMTDPALSPPPPPLAPGMGQLGTETAFDVLARAEALSRTGRDIINLGIGQPDFRTPDHVVEAAVRALRDGHHGYTPAPGVAALREAVAADLARRHNVSVPADRVLIVPGGKVTMWFAMLMFGAPGAEIIYPDPGFPIYESAIRFTGATAVPLPLAEADGFALDPDRLAERVTDRTRLIIVNSPANPTGGVAPRAAFDRLADLVASRPHLYVLSDEIYGRMLYDGLAHTSLLTYRAIADRVILLDGWSKTYAMTGWRLGYSVWPAALMDYATRLAINSQSCVNAVAQQAGIAALTGPQTAVEDMVTAFATRRRVIVDRLNRLPGISCRAPGGAFYAFANVTGTGRRAGDLQDRLLEDAGVATIAGTSFGARGEGFIRFSYAASVTAIETAMDRMADLLANS